MARYILRFKQHSNITALQVREEKCAARWQYDLLSWLALNPTWQQSQQRVLSKRHLSGPIPIKSSGRFDTCLHHLSELVSLL